MINMSLFTFSNENLGADVAPERSISVTIQSELGAGRYLKFNRPSTSDNYPRSQADQHQFTILINHHTSFRFFLLIEKKEH